MKTVNLEQKFSKWDAPAFQRSLDILTKEGLPIVEEALGLNRFNITSLQFLGGQISGEPVIWASFDNSHVSLDSEDFERMAQMGVDCKIFNNGGKNNTTMVELCLNRRVLFRRDSKLGREGSLSWEQIHRIEAAARRQPYAGFRFERTENHMNWATYIWVETYTDEGAVKAYLE